MEFYALADIDFPDRLIVAYGFPLGRHFRVDVQILIDPGQRVVDVLGADLDAGVGVLRLLYALVFRIVPQDRINQFSAFFGFIRGDGSSREDEISEGQRNCGAAGTCDDEPTCE